MKVNAWLHVNSHAAINCYDWTLQPIAVAQKGAFLYDQTSGGLFCGNVEVWVKIKFINTILKQF